MPPARLLPPVLLALAAALAGCGSTVQEGTVLTVYVSASADGSPALLDGAEQALEDSGGEAGGAPIEIVAMPETTGEDASSTTAERWQQATVAASARRATQDSRSIAYIGEIGSDAALVSVPITNEAGLLQVAPGPVSRDLLAEPGGNDVPDEFQTTGERTVGALRLEGESRRGDAAAYGYEAMAAVLAAVDRAEDPLSRADVVDAFLSTEDRESELGTYSIGSDGAAAFEGEQTAG